MIKATIGTILEQNMTHMDGLSKPTPIVPVSYIENGEVIAVSNYPMRKGSAIETMEDVEVLVKAEIERLGKTEVVKTMPDSVTGEQVEVLERDTLVPGEGVEGTPNKDVQVKVKDLKEYEGTQLG